MENILKYMDHGNDFGPETELGGEEFTRIKAKTNPVNSLREPHACP